MATLSIILGLASLIISQYFFKKIQLSILVAIFVTGLVGSFQAPINFYKAFSFTIKDFSFWKVIITIFSIFLLSELMKNSGNVDRFSEDLQDIFMGSEMMIVFVPALIGLLPMPGGAMFTAPMVKEIGEKLNLKPSKLMIANYWFRHIMEFFWPLYPAIILLAAFVKRDVRQMFLYQLPFGILALGLGVLFFISNRKFRFRKNVNKILKALYYIWPIIIIIVLIFLFKVEGYLAVFMAAIVYGLLNMKILKSSVLKSLRYDILILFFLVFFYKAFLEISGINSGVPKEISSIGITPFFLVPILPFISGLLTGVTQASIGMSFPAITGIIALTKTPLIGYITAYFFGVFGVLLSPLHLCLILTAEYYKVNFKTIYFSLIPIILILMGVTLFIWIPTI